MCKVGTHSVNRLGNENHLKPYYNSSRNVKNRVCCPNYYCPDNWKPTVPGTCFIVNQLFVGTEIYIHSMYGAYKYVCQLLFFKLSYNITHITFPGSFLPVNLIQRCYTDWQAPDVIYFSLIKDIYPVPKNTLHIIR